MFVEGLGFGGELPLFAEIVRAQAPLPSTWAVYRSSPLST